MKICYGVQGTGNGHIARARIMAKAFAERAENFGDVQVDFIFSGRDAGAYFDMEVFGDYQTRRGLTFIADKGRIDHWQTTTHNSLTQLRRDIKALDLSSYDLVLNDFEPITAWAARKQKIPSISISHQAAFCYPVPQADKSLLDRFIMRWFAPCQVNLGVHWYHFNSPILPPFIDEEPVVEPHGNEILVYLPFEDYQDVLEALLPLSEQNFVLFHPAIKRSGVEENVRLEPLSKPRFKYSLQHCAGVIANAGFELSSEALRLGKKILLKPLNGQFEQASNVKTLRMLGLCDDMADLSSEVIEEWLETQSNPIIAYPKQPDVLLEWILARNWHDTQTLCDTLWKQVKFPQEVLARARQF
jgi:uncharacterized protein (TIGR00661 family)